jgi:hypothetical protein
MPAGTGGYILPAGAGGKRPKVESICPTHQVAIYTVTKRDPGLKAFKASPTTRVEGDVVKFG